ncbi:MAG: hypothetical protein C0392_10505 [Syntrophus sp. (in: bacteria)]|nr:hypothetical protein [Syntrophus sp. (in: bacteria)]
MGIEDKEETCCYNTSQPPKTAYRKAAAGLELGDHAFLRPLPPCCAQSASPYWARIIGTVKNNGPVEAMVTIAAVIFNGNSENMGTHNDFMALDPGEKGEFDIKIKTFYDDIAAYGLEVTESLETGSEK